MLDTMDIKVQAGPNRSIAVVVKDELGRVAGHLIRPDEARELARNLIALAAEMSCAQGTVGIEHVERARQSAVSPPL